MGKCRYSSTILDLDTRWLVVCFTLLRLYLRRKKHWCRSDSRSDSVWTLCGQKDFFTAWNRTLDVYSVVLHIHTCLCVNACWTSWLTPIITAWYSKPIWRAGLHYNLVDVGKKSSRNCSLCRIRTGFCTTRIIYNSEEFLQSQEPSLPGDRVVKPHRNNEWTTAILCQIKNRAIV